MEIVLIGFFLATGKVILLCRFFEIKKMLYWRKWIDLFFTLVLPLAFYGTFHGMVTAVMSGLFVTAYLSILHMCFGCEAPLWIQKRQSSRSEHY